jgi:hypothetical protein
LRLTYIIVPINPIIIITIKAVYPGDNLDDDADESVLCIVDIGIGVGIGIGIGVGIGVGLGVGIGIVVGVSVGSNLDFEPITDMAPF